jgi:rod shape-determining protein MreD
MLRVPVMAVIIIINYVAQTTFWPELAILGITPDTALILIISYGMLRGEIEGALFGLASGFLMDMFGGVYIGLYALMGFVAGYVSGKPFRDFFKDNYFLPFFIVSGITVVYQFVLYVALVMFRGQLDFWFYVHSIILPKTVYTAALAIPLYMFMHFVNRRVEIFEHNRRNMFEDKNDD